MPTEPIDKLIDVETVEFDVATDEMLLNMGPQHPSTHGVLRLVLRTDGELVNDVIPQIGYLHRCVEKIGEKITARQFTPYTDRLDYLAAMNMNLGWALAVEKLLDLEVPEKARHLRVLMCELNRITSHLVAACCCGLDLGSFTPFLWCFRERERIVDLFEMVCGARLTYSYITVGGVSNDLPDGWLQKCEEAIEAFLPVVGELHAVMTSNAIFVRRMANIGVMSAEMAVDFGCTGPVLRGSGVDWDLRRDGEPRYTQIYDDYNFDVIVQKDGRYPQGRGDPVVPGSAVLGDSWHRYYVRMLEAMQSVRLVRQAMDKYRKCDGPVSVKVKIKEKLPVGECYIETEAPKGQMGFGLIGDGSALPWRVRVRSSSLSNLAPVADLCRGTLIGDVVAIVASLDPVMGEIDR